MSPLRTNALPGEKISAITVTPACTMGEITEQVIISINDKGVATLQLNRKPVNALNLELLNDFNTTLEKLESQKTCKGVIITSALIGIFSAGLDIREMYKTNEARLRQFRRSLQDLWMRLYGCRLVTIAVINGYSPAGGCLIALACDYRIMAEGKYTIGLNETKLTLKESRLLNMMMSSNGNIVRFTGPLCGEFTGHQRIPLKKGLVAPFWFRDNMVNTVGHRETELALQLGHLYSPEEAKRAGLVDELAPMDQIMARAHVEMDRWIQIPEAARVLSKRMLRQPTIDKLRSRSQEDIDQVVRSYLNNPDRNSLEMYLKGLKKRKQSKL